MKSPWVSRKDYEYAVEMRRRAELGVDKMQVELTSLREDLLGLQAKLQQIPRRDASGRFVPRG